MPARPWGASKALQPHAGVPVSDRETASERRHDERRRNERRGDDAAFSASLTEDSLFDTIDIGRTGGVGRAETDPAAATRSDTGWGDVPLPADSRFLTRQAQDLVTAGSSTVDRLYGAFVSARAVLGIAVLGAQVVSQALGAPSSLVLTISLVYAVQSVLLWMLPRLRPGRGRPAHTLNRRQGWRRSALTCWRSRHCTPCRRQQRSTTSPCWCCRR